MKTLRLVYEETDDLSRDPVLRVERMLSMFVLEQASRPELILEKTLAEMLEAARVFKLESPR